jgi:hypothetical protein
VSFCTSTDQQYSFLPPASVLTRTRRQLNPFRPSSLYLESSNDFFVLQVDLWQEINVNNGLFIYSALSPAAVIGLSAAPAAGKDAIASYGIFSGSQVVNQWSVR